MSRPRVLCSLLSHRQLRWVHHEGQAEEKGEIDGAESKGRTLGDYDRCKRKLEDHQPPSLLQMELQNIDRFSQSSRPQVHQEMATARDQLKKKERDLGLSSQSESVTGWKLGRPNGCWRFKSDQPKI
ncbi:unnamed protein product [Brassica rapa subsp. trilocularis]